MQITIIGGGNLGVAIAEGLLEAKFWKPKQITITRRNTRQLAHFRTKGVCVESDNAKAIKKEDMIFLAVKPYKLQTIGDDIKKSLRPEQILVSLLTGISIADIKNHFEKHEKIIRAMPNTALAIRQSMTCLSSINQETELKSVRELFDHLGQTVVIDEQLMDAATVLGACGTAFAMRYIRANIQGGIEIGFDAKTASHIAAQTVKGSADLLLQNHTHPEAEIDKVTTPKGCTIAGLNEMEHQGFSSSLIRGLVASFRKIVN